MASVHFFHGDRKGFEKQVREGTLDVPRECPACKGCLTKHGAYGRKTGVSLVPRMRCKGCGKTHAVLPHFLAPYQRVLTHVREAVVQEWALGPATGA